jgi:hypothetical protein
MLQPRRLELFKMDVIHILLTFLYGLHVPSFSLISMLLYCCYVDTCEQNGLAPGGEYSVACWRRKHEGDGHVVDNAVSFCGLSIPRNKAGALTVTFPLSSVSSERIRLYPVHRVVRSGSQGALPMFLYERFSVYLCHRKQ